MKPIRSAIAVVALVATTLPARAQQPVDDKLKGFDEYMAQVLKDWNVPGIGVGGFTASTARFRSDTGAGDGDEPLSPEKNVEYTATSATTPSTASA